MRLIDADAVFSDELFLVRAEYYDAIHAVIEKINNAPTIDAVEVIRCKDCRYGEPNGRHGCKCYHYKLYEIHEMSPNDFCSCAERRTDETN